MAIRVRHAVKMPEQAELFVEVKEGHWFSVGMEDADGGVSIGLSKDDFLILLDLMKFAISPSETPE